jgi:hypothetical protein
MILQRFSMLSVHAVNVERFTFAFGHKMHFNGNSCGTGSVSNPLPFLIDPVPSYSPVTNQNRCNLIDRTEKVALRTQNNDVFGVNNHVWGAYRGHQLNERGEILECYGKLSSSLLLHDRL